MARTTGQATARQCPVGNESHRSWLSLCWGSRPQFKDLTFQRGFASRAQLFRNPMAFSINVLNLNGPPPSPAPDPQPWVEAPGGSQEGRRGIPRCLGTDSGSWERITVTFRSLDHPRTWAAPAQHLCPFAFGEQEEDVKVEKHPHGGWLGGDEQRGGPPWLDIIALFSQAQPAWGQLTFQGQIVPALGDTVNSPSRRSGVSLTLSSTFCFAGTKIRHSPPLHE